MIETGRRKYVGESALLFATIIWGGTFVIIKESLNDISTMLFVTSRFILASILMFPFIINKRKLFTKELVKGGMLIGFFLFLGFSSQTIGLKFTSASRSSFITGVAVVIIPVLQLIIEKRPPTKGAIVGSVLVLLGLTFLSSGGNSIINFWGELGGNFNFGDFMTLLCAIFFAAEVVTLDIVSRKFNVWALTFVLFVTVAVLGSITTFIFDVSSIETIKLVPTKYLWFGILYTGVLATFLNLSLQTRFQKETTPTKAGIIYSFEPVFATTLAYFLLNEKITNFGFIGGALIFLGLLTSEAYDSIKLIYEQRFKKS